MCPRKQPNYTSEDYLNRYLDKYARKLREDARCFPQFVEHISDNHKVPKTKHAWVPPYPKT